MNKYPKEFLMRVAAKVEDPITKAYILCIDHLLEYDFEYLKKSEIIQFDFYQAIGAIAEVTKNYDYVKEMFDLMIDDVKREGRIVRHPSYIGDVVQVLIEGDKDKYEEYILNKLFGNVWKDPDFFLPRNRFLGLSDRLPTLGNLLARNTTFSDNISEEFFKKIIKGLKLLHYTIPGLINKQISYEETVTFPDCSVSKYIKQDLKFGPPYTMTNTISIYVWKDYMLVSKYIFLKGLDVKYRTYLAKKIEQYVSKIPGVHISDYDQECALRRDERINFPANFNPWEE